MRDESRPGATEQKANGISGCLVLLPAGFEHHGQLPFGKALELFHLKLKPFLEIFIHGLAGIEGHRHSAPKGQGIHMFFSPQNQLFFLHGLLHSCVFYCLAVY